MTSPGGPQGGRHSSADDGTSGFPPPRPSGGADAPAPWDTGWAGPPVAGPPVTGPPVAGPPISAPSGRHPEYPSPAHRRLAGLLDQLPDATGPMPPPGPRDGARSAATGGGTGQDEPVDTPRARGGHEPEPGQHPSAPLPPRPPGVWDRLHRRAESGPGHRDDAGGSPDDRTAAVPRQTPPPLVPSRPADRDHDRDHDKDEDRTDAHPLDWQDHTGGLEVVAGRHDADAGDRPSADGSTRNAAAPGHDDDYDEGYDEGGYNGDDYDDYDDYGDGDGDGDGFHVGPRPRRRRRRPIAIAVTLVLLVGVVAGIVLGGRALLGLLDLTAEDYAGPGTGSVEVRIEGGDTLSDIGRTLVEAGVVASVGPFVDAAEANEAATGIQPGVYEMRAEMSGQGALDRLLDPAARLLARVTVPEGLTVAATLQRLADETGVPLAELEAAAQDPAALGLPPYAGGQLEGYLYPATYSFEPGTPAQEMLRQMVTQFAEVAAMLQLEQRAAAVGRTPGEIVTIASMIQSETRLAEERPDVAQVIYNRLEQGIPLGIDATLAFGLDKSGNELTVTDLQTDSPYNTRTRQGLPPTPISAPGEDSLVAALEPSSGDLLYYVLESEDGRHFFTDDYAEFEAARQRCADAGLGCGG